MTALDAGVIIITLLFLIRGIWIGFIRQLAALAALFIAFIAAGQYYSQLSIYITKFISEPQLAFIITYASVFLVSYVLIVLLGLLLKKVMQISFLGWFDKLLGGIFGFAKAAFICTLIFMALAWILSNSNPMIQKSFFSPFLMKSSQFVLTFIKDKDLQARFTPKKPAISSFLNNPIQFFEKGDGKTK